MFMMVRNNKNRAKENFIKGNIDYLEVMIPNISDHVMEYADKVLELDKIIEQSIECNFHEDGIPASLFCYGLISSKLKRLFSVSESVLAITTPSIIEKFNLNFVSKKEFTCEGNMRKFINKVGTSSEVTDEQVKNKIKEIENKNKLIKNESKKIEINEEQIKIDLQTKQNGHEFVKLFNNISKTMIGKLDNKPTIHILDCVKQPVNINNSNYELSTVINYEGKPMRGYKMGVLRCITEKGGMIEHLIDDTLSKNDMSLVEEEIKNYDGFNENDYQELRAKFLKFNQHILLINILINFMTNFKFLSEIY